MPRFRIGQTYLVMAYRNGPDRDPNVFVVEYLGKSKFMYYSNVRNSSVHQIVDYSDFGPFRLEFIKMDLPVEMVQQITWNM